MKGKIFSSINAFLVILIIAIFLTTVILSIVFIGSKNARNRKAFLEVQSATTASDEQVKKLEDENKVVEFKEWGKIRTRTSDKEPIPVIIFPVVEYEKDNIPLHEEFYQKQPELKKIIVDYFSSKTSEELRLLGEDKVKSQLVSEINESLSMGKINRIYFDEYIFFD